MTRSSNNFLYGGQGIDFYKSSDDGISWREIGFAGSYYLFRGGLAVDTSGLIIANYDYAGPGRYYSTGSYQSTDDGVSWRYINFVAELYAVQPGGKLFAVTGGLYSSTDKGITWKQSDSGLSSHALCLEFREGNAILVGTSGGVYRSLDGGGSWSRAGLDSITVSCLVVNREGEIFAGTSSGVFHSSDTTRTWIQENSGLTDSSITGIAISPQGYVFAATSTRGIFRTVQPTTPVKEPAGKLPQSFSLEQNYPNPFNPVTHIQYQLPKESRVTLKVYNILGQLVSILVDEVQSPGNKSVAFDGSRLPSGVYLYKLTVGNAVYARKMILMK
jgi:hypothetical protein